WPQYSIPTFKIVGSSCLKKVRIGEEISFIRVKVPWPLVDREAVLHYFEIEYFREDLILVLIKTNLDNVQGRILGMRFQLSLQEAFSRIWKKNVEKRHDRDSRAIFDFDIKLDIIPPSLINFISRQLIGNGHKLYQKAVGSVAASDVEYRKALEGPLYVLIRQQLYSSKLPPTTLEGLEQSKSEAPGKTNVVKTSALEITEEDTKPKSYTEGNLNLNGLSENQVIDNHCFTSKDRTSISPEVEHALCILDQAISIFHGKGIHAENDSRTSPVVKNFPVSERLAKSSLSYDDATEIGNELNLRNISHCNPPPTESHREKITCLVGEDGDDDRILSRQEDGILDLGNSHVVESTGHFYEKLPSRSSVSLMQPAMVGRGIKVCDDESMTTNGF
ncbi:hypothetical protein HPP92_005914, partial [Vanilla planifolia]